MIVNKKINIYHIIVFLWLSSILALILAYIGQYFFDLKPCNLCLWQRKPFFILIFLLLPFIFIFSKKLSFLRKYEKLVIKIAIFILLVNAFIAFYHLGIEKKWFAELSTCGFMIKEVTTIEELKLIIEESDIVKCSEPQFLFLNISMAGWNMIYCLALVVTTIYGLKIKNESK